MVLFKVVRPLILVLLVVFAASAQQDQLASSTSDGAFYPRPAFKSPPPPSQLVPADYRFVQQQQQQQPAWASSVGPHAGSSSHQTLFDFQQQQQQQQQSLGISDRKSVKKVIGISVIAGIVLAKVLAFVVKPAILLAGAKTLLAKLKKNKPKLDDSDGRAFVRDAGEDLPVWAHAVFAGIESFSETLAKDAAMLDYDNSSPSSDSDH